MAKKNHITVICGHYGSGKTNFALNLALEKAGRGEKVTLVDMDIVNPYFRSSEYGNLLSEKGIKLIAPTFAGTTLDTPTIPPEVYSIFSEDGAEVIIDAGGDDAGITALAGMSGQIKETPYEMIYIINKNRVLSGTPDEAIGLLNEIEAASHLKASSIVNNTHLGVDTTRAVIDSSVEFAEETAAMAELPLLFTTIPSFALEGEAPKGYKVIERLVLFPWEEISG